MSSDFRLGFAGIGLGALLTAILLALPTPPEPRPSRPSLREIERERPEPTENAMEEGDEERQHAGRDR